MLKVNETAKSPILDYHVFPALNALRVSLIQCRGVDTLTFYSFIKVNNGKIHEVREVHSAEPESRNVLDWVPDRGPG